MPTPRFTIHIRADQLGKFRGLTGLTSDVALATAMGVHEDTVRRTLSGRTQLSTDFMAALMQVFDGALTFYDLFEITSDEPAAAMTA